MEITDKLDNNLYMCANGDVVTLVDESMEGSQYHSATGKYMKKVGVGSKIDVDSEEYRNGIGSWLKKKGKTLKKGLDKLGETKVGKAFRKGRDAVAKVGGKVLFAVPRTAFQGLVRLNMFGLASKLTDLRTAAGKDVPNGKDNKKWSQWMDTWQNVFMGDKGPLLDNMANGNKLPVKLATYKKQSGKGADGKTYEYSYLVGDDNEFMNVAGIDDVSIASAAALIASAEKILGKLTNKETSDNIKKDANVQIATGIIPDVAAEIDERKETGVSVKGGVDSPANNVTGFMSKYKMPLIIGGAVVAGLIGFFIYKKMKK
jgi:hypothetical protein